jgi:hypothetical protein
VKPLRIVAAELFARREEGVDALDEAVVVEADLGVGFSVFFYDRGDEVEEKKEKREERGKNLRANERLKKKTLRVFSRFASLARALTWSTSLVPMAREMAVEIAVTPPLRSSPSPALRRMRSESKNCSSSEGSHCSRFLFAAVER